MFRWKIKKKGNLWGVYGTYFFLLLCSPWSDSTFFLLHFFSASVSVFHIGPRAGTSVVVWLASELGASENKINTQNMSTLDELCSDLPVDPLPPARKRNPSVPHAPVRNHRLNSTEQKVLPPKFAFSCVVVWLNSLVDVCAMPFSFWPMCCCCAPNGWRYVSFPANPLNENEKKKSYHLWQ